MTTSISNSDRVTVKLSSIRLLNLIHRNAIKVLIFVIFHPLYRQHICMQTMALKMCVIISNRQQKIQVVLVQSNKICTKLDSCRERREKQCFFFGISTLWSQYIELECVQKQNNAQLHTVCHTPQTASEY